MKHAQGFTAAEIARGLGVSSQRVRQLLNRARSTVRWVAGQETQAWALEEIPKEVMERLEKVAQKTNLPSVSSLLRNAAPVWEPEIPLAQIDPEQIRQATLRCQALATILATKGSRPISSLIAEALPRFALLGIEPPSESTLRRLIMAAIDRDRGHEDWTRVQIYLDDRLAVREASAEPLPKACRLPALALVLDSCETPEDPASSRISILKVAMEEMKRLQEGGLSLELARASVVDTIGASGVKLSASREALRKLIRRSWERWLDGGQVVEALEDRPRSGRPPIYIPTLAEKNALKSLNLQTGSVSLAARMYARQPQCTQELREAILKDRSSKHKIPPTIREAAAVAKAVRAHHKSPKRSRQQHHFQPRSPYFLDRQGYPQRLMPGDVFERDDMSINCLYWVPWPWGGDPCSDKYGVRLTRGQLLVSLDVGSQRFLSFNLLARPKDSYRADDIWSWMGHHYSTIGMPMVGERLERGIWKARKISGEFSTAWDGLSEVDQEKRRGGLASLGVNYITAHTPSAKEIERRFNLLQNVMGTIPGQIGRQRGEMERETKLWMACRAGSRDPREHFLDFSSMLEEVEKSLRFCNADKYEGTHVDGVPDEIWERSGVTERLRKLPHEKAFLFKRDRSEITVSRASIQIRRKTEDGTRCSWWFSHEELHDWEGKKVQVYHDTFSPESGISVVDWRDRLICQAPLIQGCPQFSLDPKTRDESSYDRLRKYQGAVISECRILDPRPEQKKKIMAKISDGRGSETISTDGETNSRMFPAKGRIASHPGAGAEREAYRLRGTPEPDFEEVNRLEREAIARGDFLPI